MYPCHSERSEESREEEEKRFIADVLDDKGSALNAPPCHSEHREESREEEERFIADALNDKESTLNDRVEERAVHVGANLCVHPS